MVAVSERSSVGVKGSICIVETARTLGVRFKNTLTITALSHHGTHLLHTYHDPQVHLGGCEVLVKEDRDFKVAVSVCQGIFSQIIFETKISHLHQSSNRINLAHVLTAI